MKGPEKIWAWCFQDDKEDWGDWGGYARQTNTHPLNEKERKTGALYIRADLVEEK